jgi:type IV secretion system protein VirB11
LHEELGGEICSLLQSADVIEIQATGGGEVYVDTMSNGKTHANLLLPSMRREMIIGTVAAYHGLVVRSECPLLKAELPPLFTGQETGMGEGGRFQGAVPPASRPMFVIRRPFTQIVALDRYVQEGSMTVGQANLLREANAKREKILLAGATLSGKTVLANSLIDEVLQHYGKGLRTVLIEDTYEMTAPPGATNFEHLHTTEGVSLQTLIQTTMRLSPECIVVGEIRGPEAWDLLNVWATGHGASVSTIHADSAAEALDRLEMLAAREGRTQLIQRMIGRAVGLVVCMERVGSQQWRIKEMMRCQGWADGRYQMVYVE